MRIEKCYFCSSPVYPGHGMTFVRNDCKVFNFCRGKCHRHFKAKHNPRKLAWTKAYRKLHKKDLTNDSILEFEKKHNEPMQYNREVYVDTIKAMKKIAKIRDQREGRLWKNRMKLNKVKRVENIKKEVEKHNELINNKDLKERMQENIRQKIKNIEEENRQQELAKKGKLQLQIDEE